METRNIPYYREIVGEPILLGGPGFLSEITKCFKKHSEKDDNLLKRAELALDAHWCLGYDTISVSFDGKDYVTDTESAIVEVAKIILEKAPVEVVLNVEYGAHRKLAEYDFYADDESYNPLVYKPYAIGEKLPDGTTRFVNTIFPDHSGTIKIHCSEKGASIVYLDNIQYDTIKNSSLGYKKQTLAKARDLPMINEDNYVIPLESVKGITEFEKELALTHPDFINLASTTSLYYAKGGEDEYSKNVIKYCTIPSEFSQKEKTREELMAEIDADESITADDKDEVKSGVLIGYKVALISGIAGVYRITLPKSIVIEVIDMKDSDNAFYKLKTALLLRGVFKDNTLFPGKDCDNFPDAAVNNNFDRKVPYNVSALVFKVPKTAIDGNLSEFVMLSMVSRIQHDFGEDYGYYF